MSCMPSPRMLGVFLSFSSSSRVHLSCEFLFDILNLLRLMNIGMQRFVDLGCGNGFLTYLLISEGHVGWGVRQLLQPVLLRY